MKTLFWNKDLIANSLVPDHEADVFNPPVNTSTFHLPDFFVHFTLGGFRRWDAVYFTHIMQYGYSYENCVAFFPFFPLVVSSLSHLFFDVQFLALSSLILFTAVLVNLTLFALTAVGLYKLGKDILKDERTAYYSTLFFCINPASIFMTAPYSEILYFFTLVYALNGLNANAKYAASFFIGLGVFTRSNGLIGAGFILHNIARNFIAASYFLFKHYQRSKHPSILPKIAFMGLKATLEMLICTALCVLPFFAFQYYIYTKFCQASSTVNSKSDLAMTVYGRSRGYHLLGDKPSSWCFNKLPLSYSYIQSDHWGVGFLSYYTWSQIPNFILALPIVFLSIRACGYFLNLDRSASLSLGLWDFRALALHRSLMRKKVDSFEYDDDISEENVGPLDRARRQLQPQPPKIDHSLQKMPCVNDTVVFSLHLLSLVIFGCLFVHIQVLTRLLCSSSPLLYWYCGVLYCSWQRQMSSYLYKVDGDKTGKSSSFSNAWLSLFAEGLKKIRLHFVASLVMDWPKLFTELKLIVSYFGFYCIVGTFMFSNFLPWT